MSVPYSASEIRSAFFRFFSDRGHKIVPSAPMVVKNDPTLMFTNAGMNQFKDIFLGNRQPDNVRVANTQKCLRVSGKHNDLEEVGHDTYHHTMFEMLGNWSFGDYFKKEAIEWAWEFLTGVMELPADRLYVTVFEGDSTDGTEKDGESLSHWAKLLKGSEERIVDGSRKDNFWEMGETGPCGPCSEIHIDLRNESERIKVPGHQLVNRDHPLVVEIWNLVFIEYNRTSDGTLMPLPAKHVDTGMGLERLCMAVQGKGSNYDTDIFTSLITHISKITGKEYGVRSDWDIAMRVIADHLRAVCFAIADGQPPTNNRAGYVIRRILRRAIRYGYKNLGMERPFISTLVPLLTDIMGDSFPELRSGSDHIIRTISDEEKGFLKTLDKGEKRIEREIERLKDEGRDELPGNIVFELYDTYGFPPDLTGLILKDHRMRVDQKGFEEAMTLQRDRARKDAAFESGDWVMVRDGGETSFTGYSGTEEDIRILRYRKVRQKGKKRELFQLVFDKTPFYAEAGGQRGDTGFIESGGEKTIITDTKLENDLIVHIANGLPSNPSALFRAVADRERRELTENNHSATHILHYALRQVLGTHADQQGSFVDHERLRFDFTHSSKLTPTELTEIELKVNRLIRANIGRETHDEMPVDEAEKMGAVALFGEKYGDKVRVIRFGPSIELCGGTHASSTGRIGLFKIVSEGAIASGIRRIEALTGERALLFINDKLKKLEQVSAALHSAGDPVSSAEKIMEENQKLKKIAAKMQAQVASSLSEEARKSAGKLGGGVLFTGVNAGEIPGDTVKNAAGIIRRDIETGIAVIGSHSNGKALLTVVVSDDLAADGIIDAVTLLNSISGEIGGKGGGQKFLAVAGGRDITGIDRAIAKARDICSKILS